MRLPTWMRRRAKRSALDELQPLTPGDLVYRRLGTGESQLGRVAHNDGATLMVTPLHGGNQQVWPEAGTQRANSEVVDTYL